MRDSMCRNGMRRDHRGSSMKNANRLFGRKLSKLILTPVISFGLVAGFAVSPARAATVNVIVPCSSGDTNFYASDQDIIVFSFDPDCPNSAEFYNYVGLGTAIGNLERTPGPTLSSGSVTTVSNVGFPSLDTWKTSLSTGLTISSRFITDNGRVDIGGTPVGQISVGGHVAMVIGSSPTFYRNIVWQGATPPVSATPTITTQPSSSSTTVGEPLLLSVVASAAGTLTYQWKKDGTSVSGATSATLSIPSVALGDAGSYTVDVINTESNNAPVTVTSNAAVVTVAPASTPTPTPTPTTSAVPVAVAPKAAIEFKIPEGKPVAAAPVDVEVEGLKDQSKYVITVRSTPIIVDQGSIFNSRLKTSIKIPAGLTPGWHSITIDATAADGSPWNEVMYFEVSASGLLKSTSTLRTAKAGAIAFSAGTSAVSSATKKNIKATVKEAGKSAKYTITGSAGQLPGVSDKAVKALAKKRANVLKAYLVKLGVPKSSITIKTKVVKQGKKPKASVLALY